MKCHFGNDSLGIWLWGITLMHKKKKDSLRPGHLFLKGRNIVITRNQTKGTIKI